MKIFGGKLRGVKILKEKIRGAKISVEKNKGYEKRGKGCENILRKFKGCENTRRKFKGCEIFGNFPEKTPTGYPDLKMTRPLVVVVICDSGGVCLQPDVFGDELASHALP